MRRSVLFVLILVLCLALCACAAKKTPQPACAAAADAVMAAQPFEEMTALDAEQLARYLDIDAALFTDAAMSMDASRATAELIVFVTAKDADALKAVREALETYRAGLLSQYRDYRPEEMPKLEKAVARTVGLQTALIVSKDAEAANGALDTLYK